MTPEGLQICFFCKNNTYNCQRVDLIRKYLKMEVICPECRKHWEAKLKQLEKART